MLLSRTAHLVRLLFQPRRQRRTVQARILGLMRLGQLAGIAVLLGRLAQGGGGFIQILVMLLGAGTGMGADIQATRRPDCPPIIRA